MRLNIPSTVNEKLAEEIGWHIGDGSMNYYSYGGGKKGLYQLRGHIKDDKFHYLERIRPIMKDLYNIDVVLRDMPSTGVFGFQLWSDDLVVFKRKLGLPLGKKYNISIPYVFLKSESLKKSVVRGIFDTDGCLYLEKKNKKLYPRLEITTVSVNLGIQLLDIFRSLGFRATKWNVISRNGSKNCYKVAIRGDLMLHKFMREIKSANPKHIAKYDLYSKTLNKKINE
jgi:intein/homing endonuclease